MTQEYTTSNEGETIYLVKQIEQFLMTLNPTPQRFDVISASLLIAAMQLCICNLKDNSLEESLNHATQFLRNQTHKFSEALLRTDGKPN